MILRTAEHVLATWSALVLAITLLAGSAGLDFKESLLSGVMWSSALGLIYQLLKFGLGF